MNPATILAVLTVMESAFNLIATAKKTGDLSETALADIRNRAAMSDAAFDEAVAAAEARLAASEDGP